MQNLRADIKEIKGIGPKKAEALKKIGIATVYDLLTHFPRAYDDRSVMTGLSVLRAGMETTVTGIVQQFEEKSIRRNLSLLNVRIADGTGYLMLCWFNQKFLKRQLAVGKRIYASGKLSYAYGGRGQLVMKSPTGFQILDEKGEKDAAVDFLGIHPIYMLTGTLTQSFFSTVIQGILSNMQLKETIPEGIRQKYGLVTRTEAMRKIHFPSSQLSLALARKTLAFEELYLIQCGLLLLKQKAIAQQKGIRHKADGALVGKLLAGLPFQLTEDQAGACQDIEKDMEKETPMRRLLQGDVGSGKTILSMLALVKAVESGCQGVLMAPTEILARQHYEKFLKLLAPLGIRVSFLSGHLTAKAKRETYAALAAHTCDIVIGTHALLEESVHFAHLGLVVTDEQHRFGVAQRAALEKKGGKTPDVLVMTATPIPRTMMLTVYGDLDISMIRHLPPGRTPVRTFLRGFARRSRIYTYVRDCITAGGQAYVVCPLVECSETVDISSAEEVYEELSGGIFSGISCGLVHGRMKAAEKDRVMTAFYEGKIKLLVATTVIEVGVDVPNASVMVIEHAERFGLSQIHQLRGRVGRGARNADCILISEAKGETAKMRLSLMVQTTDGFQLAEEDLRLRGPGQFFGAMQHGLPDLKIASVVEDMDILLKARDAAIETIKKQADICFVLPILAMQYQKQFAHILEA